MAQPVTGWLGYDPASDRPLVKLVAGTKKLLTEDDSAGGGGVDPHHLTHENGGSDEINVGGLSGVLADNQVAGALDTTGATVNVDAAAPPTAGQVLTAVDATHATWQGLPASGGSSAGELFTHPTVPDSRDDEFETTTLNAAWVLRTGGASATPTKTALSYAKNGGSVANNRYQCHTDRRPSWLSFQPPNGITTLLKPITLATNDCVWARIRIPELQVSSGGSASRFQLILVAASAGAPDFNNYVRLGLSTDTDSAQYVRATRIIGGGVTNVPSAEADTRIGGYPEYLIIDKIGTSYRFSAYGPYSGFRTWKDGNAVSLTIAYAGFIMQTNDSDSTQQTYSVDFIRFSTAGFLGLPI